MEKSNNQTQNSDKKLWETPQLTVISAVEDATQSGGPPGPVEQPFQAPS